VRGSSLTIEGEICQQNFLDIHVFFPFLAAKAAIYQPQHDTLYVFEKLELEETVCLIPDWPCKNA